MAVAAGADCVMVGHAFYRRFGLERRASFNPAAYRLLRRLGFDGVAITDSVSVFGSDPAVPLGDAGRPGRRRPRPAHERPGRGAE